MFGVFVASVPPMMPPTALSVAVMFPCIEHLSKETFPPAAPTIPPAKTPVETFAVLVIVEFTMQF